MGSRPLLSGSLENYQKNAKLIEKYIVEHLPPQQNDGLVTGSFLTVKRLAFLLMAMPLRGQEDQRERDCSYL